MHKTEFHVDWKFQFNLAKKSFYLLECYWWYHDYSYENILMQDDFNKESESCSRLQTKKNRRV